MVQSVINFNMIYIDTKKKFLDSNCRKSTVVQTAWLKERAWFDECNNLP